MVHVRRNVNRLERIALVRQGGFPRSSRGSHESIWHGACVNGAGSRDPSAAARRAAAAASVSDVPEVETGCFVSGSLIKLHESGMSPSIAAQPGGAFKIEPGN